jgi:hypothetical protein
LPRRLTRHPSKRRSLQQQPRNKITMMAAATSLARGSRLPLQRWGRRIGSSDGISTRNHLTSCANASILQRMAVPSSSSRSRWFSTTLSLSIGRHRRPHPATTLFGNPSSAWKSSFDPIGSSRLWFNGNVLGSLATTAITVRHKHTFKTNKSVAKRFRARGDGTLIRCVRRGGV